MSRGLISQTTCKFGRKWFKGFARRNLLDIKRGQRTKYGPPTVSEHKKRMEFWNLIRSKYNLYDIYNADETGFARFNTKGKPYDPKHHSYSSCLGWFTCPRGSERPRLAAQDYREHVTMMACISATGRVMPPMFIIKAQSEQTYHDILSKVAGVSVIATSKLHCE